MKSGQLKRILLFVLVIQSVSVYAQNDSLKNLTFNAYTELYYSYDFAKPVNHEKPDFIYNHRTQSSYYKSSSFFITNQGFIHFNPPLSSNRQLLCLVGKDKKLQYRRVNLSRRKLLEIIH